ncbi:MAG: hypothetical protein OHK0046_33810 [Anaerolineae bacterium]
MNDVLTLDDAAYFDSWVVLLEQLQNHIFVNLFSVYWHFANFLYSTLTEISCDFSHSL